MKGVRKLLFVGALIASMAMFGCNGDNGTNGTNGTSVGTLSGAVTNSADGSGLANATVALDPAVAGVTPVVNADGSYSVTDLPVGVYSVTFSAADYSPMTASVSILAGQTSTKDAALTATAGTAPAVAAAVSGTAGPAGTPTVTLTATNATITGVAWTVEEGPAGVSVAPAVAATAVADSKVYTVTLPGITAFKDRYFEVVASRVVEGTSHSALLDRDMVMGINPLDLEEAGAVKLKATISLSDGSTTTQEVDMAAALPFKVTTGIQNVPLGIPVLLHGKVGAAWSLTAPSGSQASLADADTIDPYFTPDVTGEYDLTNATSATTLKIYAGKWGVSYGGIDVGGAYGGIAAIDANGNPDPEMCANCHSQNPAVMNAQEEWAKSGHAEILAQNVDTLAASHYSRSCFTCHTVGYDTDVDNGGIDDQTNFADFLATYFPASNGGVPPTNANNFANMLRDYPKVTSFTNIQCENCHGPNGSGLHFNGVTMDRERYSISSDVCGSCHGEPTHHGRFQEWQESGHADYSVASGHNSAGCMGCHTGQGAIVWLKQLAAGNPSDTVDTATYDTLGLTDDIATNAQPQTCVTCHDPHNPGDTSGAHGTGEVRLEGSTPVLPGGFAALGVGKGAICFVCHEGRRGVTGLTDANGNAIVGLHEDNDPYFGNLTSYATAHHGPQGSVLMGRNAYFVKGVRGAHSNIENTCVTCHLDLVPAKAEWGSAAQTNHSFKADLTICADCHGASFNGQGVQDSVQAELDGLAEAIVNKVLAIDGITLVAGDTTALKTGHSGNNVVITHADGSTTNAALPDPNVDDTIAKAIWNKSLIENDLSLGVHNPSFVHQVLNASIAAVNAIAVL